MNTKEQELWDNVVQQQLCGGKTASQAVASANKVLEERKKAASPA